MAHIKIDHPHSMGLEEARGKMDELLPKVLEKLPMETRWKGDILHVKGNGVHGTFEVLPRKIAVRLSTSMMLRMFRGQIEAELKKQLRLRF